MSLLTEQPACDSRQAHHLGHLDETRFIEVVRSCPFAKPLCRSSFATTGMLMSVGYMSMTTVHDKSH